MKACPTPFPSECELPGNRLIELHCRLGYGPRRGPSSTGKMATSGRVEAGARPFEVARSQGPNVSAHWASSPRSGQRLASQAVADRRRADRRPCLASGPDRVRPTMASIRYSGFMPDIRRRPSARWGGESPQKRDEMAFRQGKRRNSRSTHTLVNLVSSRGLLRDYTHLA